jgi:hypothetical protein
MTLEEKLQQKRLLGAEAAKQPPIDQLASATGVAAPTSAVGASLIPGSTPDQAKMMGTPAQKEAKIAAAGGETAIEQAAKLRAPSVASAEDEAKKRKAAGLSQALGSFGDRATELVEGAFRKVTSQQVQTAPTTAGQPAQAGSIGLKLDTAAKQLEGKSDTEVANITALINNIATETDPAKRNAATFELNKQLGLTAESALTADQAAGLIGKLPETVAAAAQAKVTETVGPKLTMEDFGQLGTSPEELSSLFGISPDELNNMSITDLQNKLASVGQAQFGETQQVRSGATSALLSETERGALRDVLTTLEERGVAGAEMQIGEIGKDIVSGSTVSLGGQQYSIEELLASDEMTDIVTQVLGDPKGKFAETLKATEPDLYNWIEKSQAGLQNLLKQTGAGVGQFKTIQEKNLAMLGPLAQQKDYFAKLGVNIGELRAGEIKKGDLPAAAQAMLDLPTGKQGVAMANLAQLPPEEVKALTDPTQVAALGLDRPNGLWSQYVEQKNKQDTLKSIPNNQVQGIMDTLGWGNVQDLNRRLADAMLVDTATGQKNPILQLDSNNDGQINESDMDHIKKLAAGGQLPSLGQIVRQGNVPKPDFPDVNKFDIGGNRETSVAVKGLVDALRDGNISNEDLGGLVNLPVNADTFKNLLGKRYSGFSGAGDVNTNLELAVERKINNEIDGPLKEAGMSFQDLQKLSSAMAAPENQFVNGPENLKNINAALQRVEAAMAKIPSAVSRDRLNVYAARLKEAKSNLENPDYIRGVEWLL